MKTITKELGHLAITLGLIAVVGGGVQGTLAREITAKTLQETTAVQVADISIAADSVVLPQILAYSITDTHGFDNELSNHALENGTAQISFIVYHPAGIVQEGTFLDLIYPNKAQAFQAVAFSHIENVEYNGLACQKLSLVEPRIYPAWGGTYLHRLTLAAADGTVLAAVTNYPSPSDASVHLPLSFKAWDDDITAPIAPQDIYVNNEALNTALASAAAKGSPSRDLYRRGMTWTRDPEIYIQFGTPSQDCSPTRYAHRLETAVRGIGNYRISDRTDLNTFSPGARSLEGTAWPTVTSDGALADRSFEDADDQAWRFSGAYAYEVRAANPSYVYSESKSLRLESEASAVQTFAMEENAASDVCRVSYSGWYRGGPATVRLSTYTTDTNSPYSRGVVHGKNLPYVETWTEFYEANIPIGSAERESFDIQLSSGEGATTWFDLLDASPELGQNRSTLRYTASPADQGATLGLFTVDDDYDTSYDGLASTAADVFIPYDITPPVAVELGGNGRGATTNTVSDPMSEMSLSWLNASEMGPDDPTAAVHPTGRSADRDLLSPWKSYRIYYGPYTAADIPEDDTPATADGYIYRTFVANKAYAAWPSIDAASTTRDYSSLADMAASDIAIEDLDFGQPYIFVVVGVDDAGNESEPTVQSWATNATDRFILTRGVVRATVPADGIASSGVEASPVVADLYWKAATGSAASGVRSEVTKSYDLIYWDSTSFNESPSNEWARVATVQSDNCTDANGALLADGMLRFYRASYKDRWQRTDPATGATRRPQASAEVYSMNNVILSEGFNGVSLQGLPYTNTFAAVFGTDTDIWPSADSVAGGATTIEFYTAGTNVQVSESYFFGSDGHWYNTDTATYPDPVTDQLQSDDFFTRAFAINLPNPLPARFVTTSALYKDTVLNAMVWHPLLRVPDDGADGTRVFTSEIRAGKYSRGASSSAYNLIALNLPVAVHPSKLNLVESGFVRSNDAGRSDYFYIVDPHTKAIRDGSTIYCDANNIWRFSGTKQAIPNDYTVQPNDMIILVSRNAPDADHATTQTSWTWTYSPSAFYELPTSHMAE